MESTPTQLRPSFALLGADAFLAGRPATPVQLAHACLKAGYNAAVPASWGDELIAERCIERLASRTLGPAVFCACSYVRDRLLAPGPDLAPFMLSFVAPPVAAARYLRQIYAGRPIDITYVGVCPSADDESIDRQVAPKAFFAELRAKGIVLAQQPTVFNSTFAPDRRRCLSQPGGLPTPSLLERQTIPRDLVEIEGFEYAADLAQHLILNEPVLIDLATRSGCACSGAAIGVTPAEARNGVVAFEPPRSAQPIVEPDVLVAVDLPITVPVTDDRAPIGDRPKNERVPMADRAPAERLVADRAPERAYPADLPAPQDDAPGGRAAPRPEPAVPAERVVDENPVFERRGAERRTGDRRTAAQPAEDTQDWPADWLATDELVALPDHHEPSRPPAPRAPYAETRREERLDAQSEERLPVWTEEHVDVRSGRRREERLEAETEERLPVWTEEHVDVRSERRREERLEAETEERLPVWTEEHVDVRSERRREQRLEAHAEEHIEVRREDRREVRREHRREVGLEDRREVGREDRDVGREDRRDVGREDRRIRRKTAAMSGAKIAAMSGARSASRFGSMSRGRRGRSTRPSTCSSTVRSARRSPACPHFRSNARRRRTSFPREWPTAKWRSKSRAAAWRCHGPGAPKAGHCRAPTRCAAR